MSGEIVKTRFAPSPTGMLHIGNIRTPPARGQGEPCRDWDYHICLMIELRSHRPCLGPGALGLEK
jgi:tRNA synthetases class I (E and Q), catalytic domain